MFSELVDDVMLMIGRTNPRTKENVVNYVRMTMRELQMLGYFDNDHVEETITATASPHVWDKPANLRQLRTVRYSENYNAGRWPKLLRPGKVQNDQVYFYYAGTDYFMFNGIAIGQPIGLSMYMYFPYLKYYETALRPAVFDRVAGTWTYLSAYDTNDTLRETARNLVSNWVLRDWDFLVKEGTLAKTYKMLREERMAAASYSNYRNGQKDLTAGETSESYNV